MSAVYSTAVSCQSPLAPSRCSPLWTGPSLRKRRPDLEPSLLKLDVDSRRLVAATVGLAEARSVVVRGADVLEASDDCLGLGVLFSG